MAKFLQSVSVAVVIFVGISSASPARLQRVKSSQIKVLANQEVDSDVPAQTPYPPAGIKPEIPFNLPADEKLVAPVNYYLPPLDSEPAKFYSPPAEVNGPPAKTYGPPAKTYGPPELNIKDEVEEIAQDEPDQQEEQQEEEPRSEEPEQDQKDDVQPVQSEVNVPPQQSEVEQQVNEAEPEKKALPERIVQGKNNGRKAAKLRSAKLQSTPDVSIRRQIAQPIYLGSLYAYNGQLYRI